MADYKKVNRGERFSVDAKTWNAMIDAAKSSRSGGHLRDPIRALQQNTTCILVQNKHTEKLDSFSAVTISQPATLPETDEPQTVAAFVNHIRPQVTLPTDDSDGRWFVLQEPLEPDHIGYAVALGVTVCKINLEATDHTTVETVADTAIPVSQEAGSAQILWVKGGVGEADETGEQWAIIRIGGSGAASLPTPQYQWMSLVGISQNQLGFDWIRAHALL